MNIRILGIMPGLILALSAATALPVQAAETTPPIDLDRYAQLLGEHTRSVRNGDPGQTPKRGGDLAGTRVDYPALRASAEWRRLTAQVRAAKPSRLNPTERKAFWINAYNILTIDLVARHYSAEDPIESIKDIGSFFAPVWDKEVATIEGVSTSLNRIEHEILRKMGDPRIHAAIVCASTSCPTLMRTPFDARRLDADLDRATSEWLSDPEKGLAVDRNRKTVRLSKIFDWFSEDFEPGGGPLAFAANFVSEADATWLRSAGRTARIRYFDYDWSLNITRNITR